MLSYGDVSACSLHATKVFHTVEGGALFTRRRQLPGTPPSGCATSVTSTTRPSTEWASTRRPPSCTLRWASATSATSTSCSPDGGRSTTATTQGSPTLVAEGRVVPQAGRAEAVPEPLLRAGAVRGRRTRREHVHDTLVAHDIHPRRYFSPGLQRAELRQAGADLPVAEDVAARILCLPTFHDMTDQQVDEVVCGRSSTRSIDEPVVNVLLTCAGRRSYLVSWFRRPWRQRGRVVAVNSHPARRGDGHGRQQPSSRPPLTSGEYAWTSSSTCAAARRSDWSSRCSTSSCRCSPRRRTGSPRPGVVAAVSSADVVATCRDKLATGDRGARAARRSPCRARRSTRTTASRGSP